MNAGRCTHAAPKGLDEEALEAYMNDLNEKDKTEERFRVIQEDEKVKDMDSAWISKVCGDSQ